MIALTWVAVALAATLGLLWLFQRGLIYLPSQSVPLPSAGVEEVTLDTEDGLSLTAWLVPAAEPRAAVIVFNGNAGNRAHRLPLAESLAAEGFTVLLTDYRGYGGNPGSPSEAGVAEDARTALDFITDRVPSAPIVYFGESLGAGVAIGLATEKAPAALILRSPFRSLPDIAAVHYRWLPSSLLLKDRYPNLDRIGEIQAPVLVIAGSQDRIVPPDQSRSVFEEANEPKHILMVDAGHNDFAMLAGDEMIEGIVDFLDQNLGR